MGKSVLKEIQDKVIESWKKEGGKEKPFYISNAFFINHNIYKLKIVKEDDENLLMEDGKYHSGVTDFLTKTIYISKKLVLDNFLTDSFYYTLRHELTHAFIDSYGFMQVYWNEEIVADFMAIYYFKIEQKFNEILNDIFKFKRECENADKL